MAQDLEVLLLALLSTPFVQAFVITTLLCLGLGLRDWSCGLLSLLFGCLVAYTAHVQAGSNWMPEEGTAPDAYLLSQSERLSKHNDIGSSEELRGSLFGQDEELDALRQAELHLIASVFSQFRSALSQGMYILIPLLVIELLVAIVLTLSRLDGLSVVFVSLPLKLFFFLSVEGVGLFRDLLLAPIVGAT